MNCVLCETDSFEDVSSVDSKTSEKLRVSLCKKCGLIQQNPLPTAEELKIYYSHNYRLDYKKAYTPKSNHIYRAGKTAVQRLEFMKQAGTTEGNLLDVGAGGGEFVYLSGHMGFESQGIEPNIGYSEYAEAEYGCLLKTGELDDVRGSYDVITLFHVLEHLPAPKFAFEKIYQLLNKNGVLFVEVPWIETNDASPSNIFFKAHLFYFSVETLIACASQFFDSIMVDTSSNLRIIFRAKDVPSSIKYPSDESVNHLRKRMKDKGWFEYLFKGKGLQDPIKKIIRGIKESKEKKHQPREILDKLLRETNS